MNELERYAYSFLRPTPDLTVVDWCEQNLYLSSRITETSGPFSTRLFPYMREPLNLFKDRNVPDMCLVWGTQTSKTTLLYCGLAWAIDQSPQPAMLAMHSENQCRSFSKNRWLPLIEDCDKLRAHKPLDSDYFQVLEQQFDTMTVRFTGANSAGNVSSTPVSLSIQDEIDKYPVANAKEAGAVQLLDERTKSYMSAKRFKSSTPTTEDGAIWCEWEKSDKRYFFFPCPKCGEMITFTKDMVTWDHEAKSENGDWDIPLVRKSAACHCPKCEGRITDGEKTKVLQDGQWIPTNKNADPKRRGYHLNSLYSPRITFADFVVKWVQAAQDPNELRNFINSWLAEPWKEKVLEAKESQLRKCEGEYDRGEKMGATRVMTVDTQRTDFAYNVRGYDSKGSYLIDHGRCPDVSDLDDLQEKYDVSFVGIDSGGDRTQEVYEIVHARRQAGWVALKGQDVMQLPFVARKIDPFVGKKNQGRIVLNGIMLVNINTRVWRAEMARRRVARFANWKVYRNTHTGYVRELFSEYQRETIKKGKRVVEWVKKRQDNHQWDLEVYQLALSRYWRIEGVRASEEGKDEKPKEYQTQTKPPDQPQQKEVAGEPSKRYVPVSERMGEQTVVR